MKIKVHPKLGKKKHWVIKYPPKTSETRPPISNYWRAYPVLPSGLPIKNGKDSSPEFLTPRHLYTFTHSLLYMFSFFFFISPFPSVCISCHVDVLLIYLFTAVHGIHRISRDHKFGRNLRKMKCRRRDGGERGKKKQGRKREINIYKYLMRRKCPRRCQSIIFFPAAPFYLIIDIITIMSDLIFSYEVLLDKDKG